MRLNNLQALRGIACLLVFVYHVAAYEVYRGFTASHPVFYPFLFFGFAGVDLFFVLSGFVITWVHFDVLGQRNRIAGYLGRRLWRIYPTYWFCWLAAAPLYLFFLNWGGRLNSGDIVKFLLLLPTHHANPFLLQAWSLVFEVMFYATFAVFLLLPRRAFLPILAVWSIVVFVAALAGVSLASPITVVPLARCVHWLTHPHVLEFIFGCFVAMTIRQQWLRWNRVCLTLGAAGFLIGGLAQYWNLVAETDSLARIIQFGVPSALVVYGASAAERDRGWVLPKWLQFVGDASYSIYLVHVAVFEVMHKLLIGLDHELLGHSLRVALFIAGGLTIGIAVHLLVERPLQKLARRRRPAGQIAPLVETRRAA